jgi:two-component system OmpR family response regulator
MRLMVVDGDDELRDVIGDYFEQQGYQVTKLFNARACLETASQQGFDLILIDLVLPDSDGVDILSALCPGSGVPVMVISARSDADIRAQTLALGADDFVVKPFNLLELDLRISRVLERRQILPRPTGVAERTWMRDGWSIDLDRQVASHVDGARALLTSAECTLLEALIEGDGRLVRRRSVLMRAKKQGIRMTDESVPVMVSRLRRKLRASETGFGIVAVPGLGYRLRNGTD